MSAQKKGLGHKLLVRTLAVSLAASVSSLAVAPALAQNAAPTALNIPAQPASDAIRTLARQTGTQILFDNDRLSRIRSRAVNGVLTARQALGVMLADSNLEVADTPSGAIVIRPTRAAAGVESAVPVSGEGEAAGAAAGSEGAEDQIIVVTGTNIRGTDSLPTPSTTYSRDELARTSYSTLQEVFRDIPANLADISPDASVSGGASSIATSNRQFASAVNLRGLGPQSTLTLFNGVRRPGNLNGRIFDISAIPLAIIERIEIVTGGRSAIYGSDAVAGVVNLVTRRPFDGIESQLYYGASSGREQINANQLVSMRGRDGGFLLSYDYSDQSALTLAESRALPGQAAGAARPITDRFTIVPDRVRHSFFGMAEADIGNAIELFGEASYSMIETKSDLSLQIGTFAIPRQYRVRSRQHSLVAGTRISLPMNWRAVLTGSTGAVNNDEDVTTLGNVQSADNSAGLSALTIVADGQLLSIESIEVSAAIGGELRRESYENIPVRPALPERSDARNVRSLFVETQTTVPLFKGEIDISIAGRLDSYSDFGSTFNPQGGIVWRVSDSLSLRSAASRAFRAPDFEVLGAGTSIQIFTVQDSSSPTGTSTLISEAGSNAELRPEVATSWSVGIDYTPPFLAGMVLSASYYNIRYKDRIQTPLTTPSTVLFSESIYKELIDRSPSKPRVDSAISSAGLVLNNTGIPFNAAIQSALDVFPNVIFFDDRAQNLVRETTSGIDVEVSATLPIGEDSFSGRIGGTYVIGHEGRISENAPTANLLNSPGKQVDFRVRASGTWASRGYDVTASLNYVDAYTNNFVTPQERMRQWVTFAFGLNLRPSEIWDSLPLRGWSVNLAVDNVFNTRPPLLRGDPLGLGYDPVNANPLGRFISVRMTKQW